MELRDQTVLVTGANGFVGTYVVQRLREEGMRVRALVRRPEARAELEQQGVETFLGELTDARAVEAAVRGARYVVHCAATGTTELAEARRVNVEATAIVTEAALAARCERFVHISTIAVYPFRNRADVVEEDTPLATEGDAYALTKVEAERVVNAVAARGLRTVIFRPAVILGVHPTSTWGTRIPALIAAGQFPHVDGGRTLLGFLHISSLVESVVRALRTHEAVGQTFNIIDGHTEWHRYTGFFSKGALPSLPPEQAPDFLSFRGSFSIEKARRVLGFVPRDLFDSSMDEIVRSPQ
ncbi:NAD-dependent epimerase/dehydratase family protein [Hyalangium rubrum]|uniref:NAD-dependent epimerase/dehydratase family protein n=1 Tax=Hyalangium rubrum TaxID=3103134 RepID=A0ABU5HAB2_9BACT|nr:NAD-dependent epimerase/dehydratase family protein [Hyalangium sp. s54d21]MDY7230419.1 NAD-dependent epimerase/dehydratase family protein [Hyalangium sp. s54d21]